MEIYFCADRAATGPAAHYQASCGRAHSLFGNRLARVQIPASGNKRIFPDPSVFEMCFPPLSLFLSLVPPPCVQISSKSKCFVISTIPSTCSTSQFRTTLFSRFCREGVFGAAPSVRGLLALSLFLPGVCMSLSAALLSAGCAAPRAWSAYSVCSCLFLSVCGRPSLSGCQHAGGVCASLSAGYSLAALHLVRGLFTLSLSLFLSVWCLRVCGAPSLSLSLSHVGFSLSLLGSLFLWVLSLWVLSLGSLSLSLWGGGGGG